MNIKESKKAIKNSFSKQYASNPEIKKNIQQNKKAVEILKNQGFDLNPKFPVDLHAQYKF